MKTLWLTFGLGLTVAACTANTTNFTDSGMNQGDTPQWDSNPGDGNGQHDTGTTSMCGSTPSSITGTVYAPNGMDPLPHVNVYVVPDSTTLPGAPSNVQCQVCGTPSVAVSQLVQSGPNGAFTITGGQLDAGGTFTVVIESGGFRHVEHHVTVPMCGTVALMSSQTKLPGASSGDDLVPRILVAGYRASAMASHSIDVNDHFTKVLDAIGITGYDTVDPDKSGSNGGTGNDLLTVLGNSSMLNQYQIVIIPCGSLGNFSVIANVSSQIQTNLQNWMQAGGRLYASDLAYGVIDTSEHGAITFAPGPSPHTGADPADEGVGIASTAPPLQATVVDADLLNWLQGVGVISGGGTTIPIQDLKDPWGAMDNIPDSELHPTTGNAQGVVLVQGQVAWHDGSNNVHPLTAMVDVSGSTGVCGRVVFTSYHVQTCTTTTPCTTLSPQERVLEYLFFRLSQCIVEPG